MPPDAAVEVVLWVDPNGQVLERHLLRNEITGGWRFVVRLRRQDTAKPVELRAHLSRVSVVGDLQESLYRLRIEGVEEGRSPEPALSHRRDPGVALDDDIPVIREAILRRPWPNIDQRRALKAAGDAHERLFDRDWGA